MRIGDGLARAAETTRFCKKKEQKKRTRHSRSQRPIPVPARPCPSTRRKLIRVLVLIFLALTSTRRTPTLGATRPPHLPRCIRGNNMWRSPCRPGRSTSWCVSRRSRASDTVAQWATDMFHEIRNPAASSLTSPPPPSSFSRSTASPATSWTRRTAAPSRA
jgi:hypothetical protein